MGVEPQDGDTTQCQMPQRGTTDSARSDNYDVVQALPLSAFDLFRERLLFGLIFRFLSFRLLSFPFVRIEIFQSRWPSKTRR